MNEQRTIDERIGGALHVLRTAEPRPGMEQRILASMRTAGQDAVSAQRSGWLRWAVVSLAGVVSLAVVAVMIDGRPSVLHRATTSAESSLHAPDQRLPGLTPRVEQNTRAVAYASLRQQKVGKALERVHGTGGVAHTASVQTVPVPGASEQSFPAPPLPLTEQERLLIRLVHREAPVQLAQLTTVARQATVEREREDVSQFFAPPEPLVQEQQ